MTRPVLGELLTAMVTPFADDGTVNLESPADWRATWSIPAATASSSAGTTGEGPTVNDREKLELIEAVVAEVGASASVVANTGSYDTHHSVDADARSALAAGVDGFLVVTPYYNKPPAEGIVAHFRGHRRRRGRPPGDRLQHPAAGRAQPEPPSCWRGSREIDNVIAVKQATADLDQARGIVDTAASRCTPATTTCWLPFLRLGGAGGICVASHVAGAEMRRHGRGRDGRRPRPRRRASTASCSRSTTCCRSPPTRSR